MGVVYLAHNRLMDRPEVLKVLSKGIADRGDHPGFIRQWD